MYIDPKESHKMDQEVNDATAALKGMLGIGGPVAAVPVPPTTPAAVKKEDKGTDAPSPINGEGQANAPKSNKKKKNNNNSNKKKNKGKGALNEGQAGSNEEDQKGGKQTIGNEGGNTANPANLTTKKNRKNKKKNEKGSENFAWSAFQSSPDASKLPIPAFSSPADAGRTLVSVDGDGPLSGVMSMDVPSPGPGETNVHVPAPVPVLEGTEGGETRLEKETQVASPEAPVSKTGINLAALAANPPPQPQAPVNSPSTSYMQRSNMMPQNSPGQYNTPPMPPRYPHHPNYNSNQQHHYPPPPPPGYVTVQVQVPPVLMPGRQMVVTSPAGYPVQVIVPDGIPPGFILPVHVPAGPPHMMPPPGQSPYGRQYYSPHQGAH